MRHRLALRLLLVALIALNAPYHGPAEAKEQPKPATAIVAALQPQAHVVPDKTVVAIFTVERAGMKGGHRMIHVIHGTGVLIGHHGNFYAILTAKHVVTHPGRLFVIFRDYHAAHVIAIERTSAQDLATVYVTTPRSYPVVTLASIPPSDGDRAFVLGHPLNTFWQQSSSIVVGSAFVNLTHSRDMAMVCGGCTFGDSGGPVLNAQGELIGDMSAINIGRAQAAAEIATDHYEPKRIRIAYAVPFPVVAGAVLRADVVLSRMVR